ncbi:MAG: DUF3500 domain-containing protein [Planctomycetales bacterium]|nr:DUF3500 domain-containing protein [Planctomycetales bacterium]
MKRRAVFLCLFTLAVAGVVRSHFKEAAPGVDMTAAGQAYLKTLTDEQRKTSLLDYDTPKRVDWHFIPKDERKGLQVKFMNDEQRKAAMQLLKSSLSEVGYGKARKIMQLEALLRELEKGRTGGPIRDPERYYFTLFGEPKEEGRWGLSIEGHHLSLNFVVDGGKVASSTPTFFAANPALVMSDVEGSDIEKGTRVLALEETLAFELVQSLDDEQQKQAIIADKAPAEIREAGSPQPPADENVGIRYGDLNDQQKELMRRLVSEYARNLPRPIYDERIDAIKEAGPDDVRFAWAGATKPGVGHYYRIQGSTFLIEFVNTQPDAAGNPANHIHCVWRDMHGDFAIPAKS